MLRVASGERGLRQSDGVFQHVRNLGEIMPALMADADRAKIKAVAVSTRPRPEQDSYMPVFLAGKTAAITLANALDVRLIELSHQQGHVRAALYGMNSSWAGAFWVCIYPAAQRRYSPSAAILK